MCATYKGIVRERIRGEREYQVMLDVAVDFKNPETIVDSESKKSDIIVS